MTTVEPHVEVDPFEMRRARTASGLLAEFNAAGVLTAADVHVASRLGALFDEANEAVLLAAALAVRGPRLGHVCADLATARETVTTDADAPVDLQALAWPDAPRWLAVLGTSPLVAVGETGMGGAVLGGPVLGGTVLGEAALGAAVAEADGVGADGAGKGANDRPLRLLGTRLYLDRYCREEKAVAADLLVRSADPAQGVDLDVLAGGLVRLFSGEGSHEQRLAARTAVLRRFAVVAGGPGTGKTTTVARILALLDEQAAAAGARPPRVALAAPTGKAAARLEEAVHGEAARLDVSEEVRDRLRSLEASTLHRLLGWRPGSRSRFRHDRANRLPHDVVVVDETSMVSLSLMARLVEAVRTGARLILVGDPRQLASVEAGAVLGDVVGPASEATPDGTRTVDAAIGQGIAVLRHVHRYGGGIAALAVAVQRGDAEEAVGVLRAAHDDVRWIDVDAAEAGVTVPLAPVRQAVVAAGKVVTERARAGDGRGALDGLSAMRLLCAHRRGPYGAASWAQQVERWLAAGIDGYATGGRWYVGRPLLVTANDYGLRLYNGDTGVVVASGAGHATAVFERRGELVEISPTRLAAVDTVHAMTVHKSQGSQFDEVAVVLPDPASSILTRELLYTAITRATTRLTVIGAEDSVRLAVTRPIARASGLRARLWGA